MTKTEFLNHLEKRLQILKQNEREDILGEYTQHIELKMENGLSEEEAIRDFGDLDELADEILDAYNVNPDFGRDEKRSSGEAVKEIGRKAESAAKAAGNGLTAFFKNLWGLICRMAAACKRGILLVFGQAEEETVDGTERKKKRPLLDLFKLPMPEKVHERRDTDMWEGLSRAGRKTGSLLIRLLLICWRLCVLVFLVAPAAFCDALAFIGIGLLIMLVLQGYPLVGMLIMTAGFLICGVTFVWFIWNLVFGRKEEKTWDSEEN